MFIKNVNVNVKYSPSTKFSTIFSGIFTEKIAAKWIKSCMVIGWARRAALIEPKDTAFRRS